MSSLSIVQKIFDRDDGNNFVWRGSRKDCDTIATHVSVKKNPYFTTNIGVPQDTGFHPDF